ncbi:MAG: class IV adenylate cyclase [Bryobacteraceae bacterium]|nr:class IV adenylate cyclase [Bryobacteraceae bacterium]
MTAHGSNREIEIKLRAGSVEAGRRALRRAGFRVTVRRVFESNTVYDTSAGSLRGRGELLRLREAGEKRTLTFKGPAAPGRHKSREELELSVSDAGTMGEILIRLGMAPVFRYDKYRTEYCQPGGEGVATLDETPIGVFLELEGSAPWIDAAAAALGFAEEDYITASYGRLYLEYRESHADAPHDMVFAEGSRRRAPRPGRARPAGGK